jgi:hypothetical protein
LRQTGVGCGRRVEFDLGLDPVEDLRLPDYARPLDLENKLETKANPEDRFFPSPGTAKGLGLGVLVRVSGAGREYDQAGGLAGSIIDFAPVTDQYLVKFGQQVLEVTGEGILMVD